MSDTATVAPADAQQAPPSPAPADISRDLAELKEAVSRIQTPEYEPPSLYDGKPRATYPDAYHAGKALSRARRERPATEESAATEEPIDELHYRKEPYIYDKETGEVALEVSAKQAAKDINEYRAAKAAQLRAELLGEEVEQPQPEQPQPVEQLETEPAAQAQPSEAQKIQETLRAVDQARQTYADALNYIVTGSAAAATEFSDIKTPDDLVRLAQQDPAKLARCYEHFQRREILNNELTRLRAEDAATTADKFQSFAERNDALVEEIVPELAANADPKIQTELQTATVGALKEAGFTEKELMAGWHGKENFSLRDARVQRVLAEAGRWRVAQNKARTATTRPTPPVQRPGTAMRHEPADNLGSLMKRLSETGHLKDAARYRAAMIANRGK